MKNATPRRPLRTCLLSALAAFISLAPPVPPAAQAAQPRAQRGNSDYIISYVVDGDSLWVSSGDQGGKRRGKRSKRNLKLRLRGIDAPELCQRGGAQARDALLALAPPGRNVRVTVHARDRYGRAIANVILMPESIDLSRHMAAQGWAWSDDWRARRGPYAREHQQAVQAGRGLFAQRDVERPADFRRRRGPCTVRP